VLRHRILLTVSSGALIWPIGYLLERLDPAVTNSPALHYSLIGGVFGALVLAPFVTTHSYRAVRMLGLVVASISIYSLAVSCATNQYGPLELSYETSVLASGLLGALLVGIATKLIAPLRISSKCWLYLSLAGLIGGFLFSHAYDTNKNIVMALVYLGWQLPVFLALYSGSIQDQQPELLLQP